MKKVSKITAIFAAAVTALMSVITVSAYETTVYTGNTETDYRCGVVYGRGLQLVTDEAGENKGNVYVTSEYYNGKNGEAKEYFHIYESSDEGRTFEKISGVYDTENNKKKFKTDDNWETYYEVEENSEGATAYRDTKWSFRFQPTLYELPDAVGNLPKGTVLCVGLSGSQLSSGVENTSVGDVDISAYARMDVYYSTDGLRTWNFLSHIADTSGAEEIEKGTALWEPYFILESGKLYCFYSDERGMTDGGGQKLSAVYTTDGTTWSEPFDAVNFEEENNTFRPGMPIVSKMADGRYILVYEGVNMNSSGTLMSYYKITDDIEDWNPTEHGHIYPSSITGGSPYCTVMPDGAVVIGAYGSAGVAVNRDNLETDTWTMADTDISRAYTRCLFPLTNGKLFVVSGDVGYGATKMSSLTCGAVELNDAGKILTSMYKIPLDASMVTSSEAWNNGDVNVGTNVVDGDVNTFFDGLENGYVTVDLGSEYAISAINYAPRSGYEGRMVNGIFSGSKDGENWSTIYTVEAAPTAGVMNFAYPDDLTNTSDTYRYIKYTSDGVEACNIAELGLYALSNNEAINKAAVEIIPPSQTTENITLPTDIDGVKILWTSSNPAVISKSGKVTQTDKKSTVILTAVLTSGEDSITRIFTVTVPGAELPVLLDEDFSENSDKYTLTSAEIADGRLSMQSTATDELSSIQLDKEYIGDTMSISFDFEKKPSSNSYCDFNVTDSDGNSLMYFNFKHPKDGEDSITYSKTKLEWDDTTAEVSGAEHHIETVLENGIAEMYIDGVLVGTAESKAKNISKINIISTYNDTGCYIDNLVISGKDNNKEYMQVCDSFKDKLTIEKRSADLVISSIDTNALPELIMYKAIYNNDNMLKNVEQISYEKSTDGSIAVLSLSEPQIQNGESYKFMLWSDNQSPLIPAIQTGFFE